MIVTPQFYNESRGKLKKLWSEINCLNMLYKKLWYDFFCKIQIKMCLNIYFKKLVNWERLQTRKLFLYLPLSSKD